MRLSWSFAGLAFARAKLAVRAIKKLPLRRSYTEEGWLMALSNNDILKKLRVALKLRDDDIIGILRLVDFDISKSELNAMFRKEDHPNYMPCGDQLLRNFLNGLIVHLRGPSNEDAGHTEKRRENP
jgi:hypothetical protein